MVIVNTATGMIRNTLDGSPNFEAFEGGGITIVNAGTLSFTYTEGATGGTTYTAQEPEGAIQITNTGSIDVGTGPWTINCANGGGFAFSQQTGSLKINYINGQTSSSPQGTDTLTFTFAGGTVEANRLEFLTASASLRIENAAECVMNSLTFDLTAIWQGATLRNNASLQINTLTVNAYGAGFLFDNRSTVEIVHTNVQSQSDDAGPYPVVTLENRGDATLSNYNATANGSSGTVGLINYAQLSVGNQNLDGNYGGTIQSCNLAGTATFNNVNSSPSGASHGKLSQVDLITAGGTMQINNFAQTNTSGIATILNMAETTIHNIFLTIETGGITKIGSQAGNLALDNFNTEVTGRAEEDGRVSTLTIWNLAVLTMEVVNALCNDNGTFTVPVFEIGAVYTFSADCTIATDGLASAASAPQPANGASAVETASVGLSWLSGDPDGDTVTYDLYLAPDTGDTCLLCAGPAASGLIEPAYTVSDLEPGTTYAWQVVTHSGLAAGVPGPVWSFTTQDDTVTPEETDQTNDDDDDGGCFCFIATAGI